MKNKQPLTEDTIIEEREDFMLSSVVHETHPTLRTAHFLKPISNSIQEQPPFKFNPSFLNPNDNPLKINFRGWHITQTKWVSWVHKLKQNYESVWKKVGIFDAIMATKCYIHKDQNLLYGVVEKWCSKTNTFVFSFGEATVILEDIMVLGGYPVLD
ncbi:putative aminotransferase-like, plant mobile domain-containing protein [Medicago truncatula]|uniref:Putative aminotransferase-like, plant mobile domain-containing protein n=1 Tax=Medicago truncatula TaxID=3880 RepID=A0A396IP13_MEDTR|nr:putative aminotransferase-like, plant mobile domain-containing protein [Medicago truncatula]